MMLWWGPELTFIYNDGYAEMLGKRHPEALGRSGRDVWSDVWPVIEPQVHSVLTRGEATWNDRVHLLMERNGVPEHTWFTWSYSPLRDESGQIVGLFNACREDTTAVVSEREREHYLAALQAERANLAGVIEQAPAFICVLRGPEHVYERANELYIQLIGGRRDIIGKPIRDVLPEIERQGFLGLLDEVYRSGKPFVGNEVEFVPPAGSADEPRHLNFVFQPIRDDSGNVSGIFVHGVDISDRVRDERRLLRNEQQSRALLTATSDVMYRMSGDWATMLPLDGRALVPSSDVPIGDWAWIHRNLPVDEHARVRKVIDRAIAEKSTFELEHRVIGPNGSIGWTFSRAVPILDEAGNIIEWFGAASDITDRKRAEADLRESEERRRLALESAEIGSWNIEIATFAFNSDERFQRIFCGGPCSMAYEQAFACIHPDDAPEVAAAVAAAIRAVDPLPYSAEYRVVHGDGRVRWVFAKGRTTFVGEGATRTAKSFDGTVIDITERKLTEVQRQRLLEDAEAARKDADFAARMKDEFLATLSHELRTPLSAILGWSQILKRPNQKPDALADGLATIERNARAQTQIIDDLLDMSRIISGKIALNPQRIELVGVVRAAMETVRAAATAKNISLVFHADELAKHPVLADVNRLQQVFWNLLSNAIKFTPRGGVVRTEIDVRGSQWNVDVTDTGEGIAPAFVPYVFDRFRQADASTTRRHGGLGLGLAIVKQLVELHGGHVAVQSDGLGTGSTFTVALPMTAVHSVANAGLSADQDSGSTADTPIAEVREGMAWDLSGSVLRDANILVVDDEPDARALLVRLLEDQGATVSVAADASQAFQLIQENRYDVVVSDVGMPSEDGLSLMRRVRKLPRERGGDVPSIALTAYARAEDRVKAIRAGFQLHVPKPVEPAELISMIETLLDRQKS